MSVIVVGVDGSSGSHEALRFALQEARLRSATLRMVTAWHFPAMAYGGGYTAPFDKFELEQNADATSEQALAALRDEAAGIDVQRVVNEGQAAHVLVDEAKDADMLVVGSRGHGGFAGLLLGSVSQQCAHHASCPVVIVNEPDAVR